MTTVKILDLIYRNSKPERRIVINWSLRYQSDIEFYSINRT